MTEALRLLDARNAAEVTELLLLPTTIKGYEAVKSAAAVEAKAHAERLLAHLKRPRTIEIAPIALTA